ARVAELIRDRKALERWREMVLAAQAENLERIKEEKIFEAQRDVHILRELADLPPAEDDSVTPRPQADDPILEFVKVPLLGGGEDVAGVPIPRNLRFEARPRTEVPLPLSRFRPLSLAECYAVLATIHDATLKGVENIDPWAATEETTPVYYLLLLERA